MLLLTYAGPLLAQDSIGTQGDSSVPRSWFRLGVGATREFTFIGGGVFFRASKPLAIGMRGGFAFETTALFRQPSEALWEMAPSLAYVPIKGPGGMISFVVGVGVSGGVKRGEFLGYRALLVEEYEKHVFRSLCFTIEAQGTFFLTRNLGLSGAVFTNVNGERSFTGYHIGLQFTSP